MNLHFAKTLWLVFFIPLIVCIAWGSNASADDSIVMDDAGYAEAYTARKMRAMDKDGSGGIEETEAGKAWRRIKMLDADKNGAVSLMELKNQKLKYLETEGLNKLNIRYKETAEENLFLDLYLPAGDQVKDCPVIVYTHGGGWATGSKQGAANASFAKVFTQLLDEGFAVASVNYRLVQEEGTTAMRDCVIDCKDAIRFISKHHDELKIDPNRFYVMGDSAGGQIAQMLLLSSPESLPGDRQLASVPYKMVAGVSWYGPCDFEQTDLFNHDDRPNFRDRFGPRIAPRGTKPTKKLELYREMSPVNYLTKDSPPLLMIQGDKDTTIPVKHAYRMQKQAEELGAAVETLIVKNAGHNWRKVGAEIEPSRKSIVDRTVKFFVASQSPSHHEPSDEVSSVSRMPEFSWDTIPRYIHIRKAEKFTDEELQYLAGFSLITLEKMTGVKSYGSTDAGTIEAAKSIKQINPDAKVLFYRNVFVHYPGYSFDNQLDSIAGWFLKTKRGEDRVVRKQSRGYDTSNEPLRKWWVDSAAQVCQSQHVDGLFLDGNIKSLSSYLKRQLPKGKKEETIEGYRNMMTDTRKALGPEKLMVANIIRARFPRSGLEYMNYFDGTYLECFVKPAGTKLSQQDYLAKGIEATQTVAREGKIVAMTLGLGESGVSDGVDETHKRIDDISAISQDQLQFKLALFLICAEKHSYLCLHDGYCVDTRGRKKICQSGLWLKSLPEYQKPLGPPKGAATRNGYIYTRDFEHASVWLDIENSQGKVTWK